MGRTEGRKGFRFSSAIVFKKASNSGTSLHDAPSCRQIRVPETFWVKVGNASSVFTSQTGSKLAQLTFWLLQP